MKTRHNNQLINSAAKIIAALAIVASLQCMPTFATKYEGDSVYQGLDNIQPGDVLVLPENTYEASLTASWAVEIEFFDYESNTIRKMLASTANGATASFQLPEAPARAGFKFAGWQRTDTSPSPAILGDDGMVTGITGPGPITYIATYEPEIDVPNTGIFNAESGPVIAAASGVGVLAAAGIIFVIIKRKK